MISSYTLFYFRPDFDRGVDKLRKLTTPQIVEKILPKFMEENDISVIETKIIPCNNIFHVSPPSKETEEDKRERKKAEKEKKKQEKKEKREAKKAIKKEAREREEMEKFTQRLSIDVNDSKLGSETTSVGGDSLKKEKKVKVNPLKAIKKLGSTLSRSSSTKRQSSSHSKDSPSKIDQQNMKITPSRPPLPDFRASSVDDEESESVTQDSQKNSESHLI